MKKDSCPPSEQRYTVVTHQTESLALDAAGILSELRQLIHSARQRVATVDNVKQIIATVSRQLHNMNYKIVSTLSTQCLKEVMQPCR